MALIDWDSNGKNDFVDDFIEYNIYKESMKETTKETDNVQVSHSTGGLSKVVAFLLCIGVIYLIGWIMGLGEPKCIHSGCDNSPEDGSQYCVLHEGGYSKQYRSRNYSTGSSASSNYGSNYGSNNESTTSNSPSSSSENSSTKTSNSNNYNSTNYNSNNYKSSYDNDEEEDPYNAKDYSDAEDFYDDNYDDFDGYEDAEDYYDEWGE